MKTLINIEDLHYKYPTGTDEVLCGVSFSLEEGEILSILGPNGSGKSTLLDCMANLATPTSGSILFDGCDIRSMRERKVAEIVGYVPQNTHPTFAHTVLDYVLMGRAPHIAMFSRPSDEDVEKAYEILEQLGILYLAEKAYTEISGGERQQATIARVVCQDPRVILFDEPTAHLDYGNQHRILRLIRTLGERGYSAVFTTHNPDHALLLGGRAAVLGRNGKLTVGYAEKLIEQERMRELYRIDMEIKYVKEAGRICCLIPEL
jgi:iron complex transport system ATP-binding protein